MFPKSRGGASVVALALGALVLLAALWAVFAGPWRGTEAPRDGRTREPGAGSPAGLEDLDEAADLSRRLREPPAPPAVPDGLVLHRPPVERPAGEPGVTGLTAEWRGFTVSLRWTVLPDRPTGGYLVERIRPDGRAEEVGRPAPGEIRFEDAPVPSLIGERKYRVSALAPDGTVSGGPRHETTVQWDFATEIEFLGSDATGSGRFRVRLRDFGEDAAREFAASPGEGIGRPSEAVGRVPPLDWSTGYVFRRVRGRRREELGKVQVPVLDAAGRIVRAGGSPQMAEMELRVSEVVVGAEIYPAGTPEDVEAVRWLPETKD